MTRERKSSATQDPWTQQDSTEQRSPFTGPMIVVAAIFAAGFVWFIASTIHGHSTWGRIITFLLYLLAVVIVLGAIAAVTAGSAHLVLRVGRVTPQVDGRYDMRRRDLDLIGAPGLVMERLTGARLAEASRALPPGVQSVSQSASNTVMDPFGLHEEPAGDALAPEALVTWAALEAAGEIRADDAPVIGWDMTTNRLLRLRWKEDMGSIVVVGLSGTGKTTLALSLAYQAARDGGKLVVCDRHAEDEESSLGARMSPLRGSYLTELAQSDDEIVEALRAADAVLQRRIAGDRDRSPVVVMVEELSSLMQRIGNDITPILKAIGDEGRKFGVNAITFAQQGSKKDLGDFRDSATTTAVFNCRPDHARMALGYAVDIPIRQYGTGQFFLQARREVYEHLQAPLIEASDVLQADVVKIETGAERLGNGGGTGRKGPGTGVEPALKLVGGEVDSLPVPVDSRTRSVVIDLMVEHGDRDEVAKELCRRAGKQPTGRAVQTAKSMVDAVIAEALERQGGASAGE